MLFTTYVELDTGEEGRDSSGMSFDCQLSVKFRKKEGRSETHWFIGKLSVGTRSTVAYTKKCEPLTIT